MRHINRVCEQHETNRNLDQGNGRILSHLLPPCSNLNCVALQMKDFFTGSKTHCVRHLTPDPTIYDCEDSCNSPKSVGIQSTLVSTLTPLDPIRQAKRLPIRILKMLTAHSHLLHPEYLQPLTSAAVSIEVRFPVGVTVTRFAVRTVGEL